MKFSSLFKRRGIANFGEGNWATRCGRCAEILPDETMSFCPSCGVPFSRVPPTTLYETFTERKEERAQVKARLVSGLIALTIFMAFWAVTLGVNAVHARWQGRALREQRSLVIYTYNVPGFPALDDTSRRLSIGVAMQAFQDHFGAQIPEIKVLENQAPPELMRHLRGGWVPDLAKLSFWEDKLLFEFAKRSGSSLSDELPVVMTNFPLYADQQSRSGMETRHLSQSRLISGLGSPAFVLVSTYRLLSDDPIVKASRPAFDSDMDRARYVGEYLLAHELGHALLGLSDHIIENGDTLAKALRAPASLPYDERDCLMHTDAGGGAQAWQHLKRRKLGQASSCHAYDGGIAAFELRRKSLRLLKQGARADAERLHSDAIEGLQQNVSPWITELTRKEHALFLAPVERWWKGLF